MIKQILELVRENSQDLIVNNKAIPNEQNESAIAIVVDSLLGGIKQMASNPTAISGQMNGSSDSGLMNQMVEVAVLKMSSELGLSTETAQTILTQLLPRVFAGFGSKLADPNNSEFTIHGLIQHLTGAEVPADLSSALERFISPNTRSLEGSSTPTDMLNMVMGLMGGNEKANS